VLSYSFFDFTLLIEIAVKFTNSATPLCQIKGTVLRVSLLKYERDEAQAFPEFFSLLFLKASSTADLLKQVEVPSGSDLAQP